MGRRQYPYLQTTRPISKAQKNCRCAACGAPATRFIWMEFSWFRGDDERAFVCDAHLAMARENLPALVRLIVARTAASGLFRYLARGGWLSIVVEGR